ncbi:hybrid sensor histidine kinase/response regulator [Thermosulfuriphilus sp.]
MGFEEDVLKDFLVEAKENLEQLDEQFVELEQDPQNRDLLSSIFRTVHTIKGTAGFFGFKTLEGIAHFAEDILSKLRDGLVVADQETIDILLKAVDYIKAIVAELESSGKEPTDTEYLDFIIELRNFAENLTQRSSPSEVKTSEGEQAPVVEETSPEEGSAESPKEVVSSAEKQETAEEEPEAAAERPSSAPKQETKPAPAKGSEPAKKAPSGPPSTTHLTESHIRVDVHLLDNLMNLAGELVLSRNRLVQIANSVNDPELLKATQRLSLITTEMQEQIMKTRMQPVGNVFNKFPRIVRDLARMANKQVQLKIEGAETELDRSIIEAIKDPLTHLVRNSIDHGIEPPDIRVQKGKPPVGTLIMKAYHEGGQVIIEIQDDGGGIDPEKIRQKAIEKGVVSREEAENLSDREVINLIFKPGFSTAEQVTNISGRGVGMDVVKTNIEKMGGTVEVLSDLGQGTTIRIKIPLTLAIIPAIIVRTRGERYAIPQMNLVELVHLSAEEAAKNVHTIAGSEFYRLRGEILPLVRLDKVLNLPQEEDERDFNIVVLNTGDRQFGLVVDDILDSEEIVVKPLSKHLKDIACYAGATLMGDGRAALILDIVGLASSLTLRSEEKDLRSLAEKAAAKEAERQFLLLFRVSPEEVFAIPLALVARLDKIKATDIEYVGGKEVIQYRNRTIPLVRLEQFLPIQPLPEQEEYHLIAFTINSKDVAFLVSSIEDSVDVAVELDDSVFRHEGILGSAIIKGKTTLFLDVYKILEMFDPDLFAISQDSVAEPIKVLIAEDSSFYRNLLRSYLEGAGFDVVVAEDGQEALEHLRNYPVDVLVTDIEMPRMNGYQLARAIRQDPKLSRLPIVAVTSLSGEEDRKRGLEAGIDDYQVKLDREMVLEAVKRLYAQKARQAA